MSTFTASDRNCSISNRPDVDLSISNSTSNEPTRDPSTPVAVTVNDVPCCSRNSDITHHASQSRCTIASDAPIARTNCARANNSPAPSQHTPHQSESAHCLTAMLTPNRVPTPPSVGYRSKSTGPEPLSDTQGTPARQLIRNDRHDGTPGPHTPSHSQSTRNSVSPDPAPPPHPQGTPARQLIQDPLHSTPNPRKQRRSLSTPTSPLMQAPAHPRNRSEGARLPAPHLIHAHSKRSRSANHDNRQPTNALTETNSPPHTRPKLEVHEPRHTTETLLAFMHNSTLPTNPSRRQVTTLLAIASFNVRSLSHRTCTQTPTNLMLSSPGQQLERSTSSCSKSYTYSPRH
jgi:hypothetical protein